MKKFILLSAVLITSSFSFDLGAITKDVLNTVTKTQETTTTKTASTLSQSTVSNGLKEALNKGVEIAVTSLGKENGYLNNSLVKIPLPNNLDSAATLVKQVGGEKYINDLEKSMNDAATQAAPKTAKIFTDAISKMSIDDASKILNSGDDAATNYFKENTLSDLKTLITPIVKESISKNQVATYYDAFNGFYQSNVKGYVKDSSLMGYAKSFGVDSYIPGDDDKSLDEYITNKAIDGLFVMIAKEEKAIRENPVERTTDLLKQVFGN